MRSTIQYAFLLPFDIHLTHHILFFDQHLDNKVDSDDNGSVDDGVSHWSGLTNIYH